MLESVRTILFKVVLFKCYGHGNPQGGAIPNFFPYLKVLYIPGLSYDISLVSKFILKVV